MFYKLCVLFKNVANRYLFCAKPYGGKRRMIAGAMKMKIYSAIASSICSEEKRTEIGHLGGRALGFRKPGSQAGPYIRKRLPFPPAYARNAATAVHGPARRLCRRGPFPAMAARIGRGETRHRYRQDIAIAAKILSMGVAMAALPGTGPTRCKSSGGALL